jgi:hypothetical protein
MLLMLLLLLPRPPLLLLQVLKTPNLVSSVFFMCLPDKVRGRSAVVVGTSSSWLLHQQQC